MTTVKVPEIPGPLRRLCYTPQPLGDGMFRCDRVEGHSGRQARHKRTHPEVWYAGYQAGFAAYSRYLAKVRKAGREE